MEYGGYSEEDLVSNRAALLLYGGNEADRRAWAHEAAGHFAGEGPLVEIRSPQELSSSLGKSRGVVFIPDALALGLEAQSQILRCLQEREERPKIIIALPRLPDEALQQGLLRDDLSYRLRLARVNLDAEGLGGVLQERRRKLEEKLAAAKELVQARPSKKAKLAKAGAASRRKGAAARKLKSSRSRQARPARKPPARRSRRASKKLRSVKKSSKKRR
ncbi:MAG TPA: Fis family transcriptional regulator [Myxococcaceae bacterium]|nr:Fis family transcriptional regulator [Myxococcaceae bacterium]